MAFLAFLLVCIAVQMHAVVGVKHTKDTEPPKFVNCPKDIIKVTSSYMTQVFWEHPSAVDNSGLPPIMSQPSYHPGTSFRPGEYTVEYNAMDRAGNRAVPCRFKVVIKKKKCQMYDAPKNGALACWKYDEADISCAPVCSEPYDFAFDPPLFYFCAGGKWFFWQYLSGTIGGTTGIRKVPWPDCKKRASPSFLKKNMRSTYMYQGDANQPGVKDQIAVQFIKLMKGKNVAPFFCTLQKRCTASNVEVTVGDAA